MTKIFRAGLFLATVVVLVLGLKFANWLPMFIQKDTLRRYSGLEEVTAKLGISDIYAPRYFPGNLAWPPSEILAQTRPYIAVVMEFKNKEKGDTSLIICQSASEDFKPYNKIRLARVNEKVSYLLKGRKAVIEVGTCSEEPCSRISWDEGKYKMTVAIKSQPSDLIKISESMVR